MALIKCPQCGKEIEETENFCYYCGKKLKEENDKQISVSNTQYTSNKGKKSLIIFSIISYIIAIVFVGLGFNKMFVYNSGEYFGDPVNAYVGGDAYNLIINANYATAYFSLAILCCIIGGTFIISYILLKNRKY